MNDEAILIPNRYGKYNYQQKRSVLRKIRHFLIGKLAGNDVIILNAILSYGTKSGLPVDICNVNGALMKNTTFCDLTVRQNDSN